MTASLIYNVARNVCLGIGIGAVIVDPQARNTFVSLTVIFVVVTAIFEEMNSKKPLLEVIARVSPITAGISFGYASLIITIGCLGLYAIKKIHDMAKESRSLQNRVKIA